MKKYVAYYQESYGAEEFFIRNEEEKVIVVSAPDEETAEEAFKRAEMNVAENGYGDIEKTEEGFEHLFVIEYTEDTFYDEPATAEYNYNEI